MSNRILNIKDWGLKIDCTRPIIITGPCSAETKEQLDTTAKELSKYFSIFRAGIWKPRTNPGGFVGVGIDGLEWLKEIKEKYSMLISIEVPNADKLKDIITRYPNLLDIIWIGARTSGDPFAVQEMVDVLKDNNVDIPVLIKNPISPDLDLWCGAINRFLNAGFTRVGAIHRGFNTITEKKYRNSPIWNIPIELKNKFQNITLICDPSHIGGKREYIQEISQMAMDLSFDGLMIESHCNPDCALTDAKQQLIPSDLKSVLDNIQLHTNTDNSGLKILRNQIDDIDKSIIQLLSDRMKLSEDVAKYKKHNDMQILQTDRYNELLTTRKEFGNKLNLSSDFIESLYTLIHEQSIIYQNKIIYA